MNLNPILIATPLWPPQIGGPAQYAVNLAREFKALGHEVVVAKFSAVGRWPSGLRHLVYFFKLWRRLRPGDWCLILDASSVAWPAVWAARLRGAKTVLRIGGDFLWESYVERTGDLVLLRQFYQTTLPRWNLKERLIFRLTRATFGRADRIVFNTDWQRAIWREPYGLAQTKTAIVENYGGDKKESFQPTAKIYLFAARPLKLKNEANLRRAFALAKQERPEIELEVWHDLPAAPFAAKLDQSYAVIVPSISEVSSNLAREALARGKPLILTRESGDAARLGVASVLVDPLSITDLKVKIVQLADAPFYERERARASAWSAPRSWPAVAADFLAIFNSR